MWPLRTISFFLLFVALCGLSLAYPLIGVVNYMLIYQVHPSMSWWGRPLEDAGVRFSMTAAVFLILGMVLSSTRMPRVSPVIGAWQALFILLVGIAVLSCLFGVEVENPSLVILDKFCKLAVFVLCLTHVASDRKGVNAVLWAFVIGALVLGYDAFNAPQWQFTRGRLDDVGGPDFRQSSGLAAHLAAALPLIGVVFLRTRGLAGRSLALAAGVLAVNAIILCRTRSAFVGLAAGVAAAVLLAPRLRRFRVYTGLALALAGAYALTDASFWNRMSTLVEPASLEADDAATLRRQLWNASMAMIADHPLGIGIGNFTQLVGQYDPMLRWRAAHNTYLLCCVELGVQGLIVFALVVMAAFAQLYRCRELARRGPDPAGDRLAAYGLAISLVVYLVTSIFTERFYTESFWWILALPTCLQRAVAREVAETEEVPALAESSHSGWEGLLTPSPA